MKLQEIIDIVNGEKRLFEMSFHRNEVIARLMDSGLKFRRFYHLILIYYFRESQELNHWISELTGFIPESPLIKKKNHRLDEQETLHYIWTGYVEDYSIEEVHSIAFSNAKRIEETNREREERKTEKKFLPLPWGSVKQDPKDAYLFMEEFHKIISGILSAEGGVSFNDVHDTILSLLEKYPLK